MPKPSKSYALALCAFALVACGGSKNSNEDGGVDGSASSDQSAAATKACNDEATAVCALRETCGPGFEIERLYGTAALCQSRTAQSCLNAIDAKGTANTVTQIEACTAAYPTESCSDFFDNNPVAACQPLDGSLAADTACGSSFQCTTGYCAVDQHQICGTCQTPPAVGATCAVAADCGRDLACAIPAATTGDGGVATGLCAAWVASGGACLTGYQPCANGLACVGDNVSTMTTGICQAQPTTTGAACDGSRNTTANCNGNFGVVCIPTAKGSAVGTCQPIQLVAVGAACGPIGSAPITGYADCASDGLCKKAVSTDTTGVCVAPAADGASCDSDPTIGPTCLSPAKCVVPSGSNGTSGTCTVPNASSCM